MQMLVADQPAARQRSTSPMNARAVVGTGTGSPGCCRSLGRGGHRHLDAAHLGAVVAAGPQHAGRRTARRAPGTVNSISTSVSVMSV